MEATLLPGTLVDRFRFWYADHLLEGMNYKDELFCAFSTLAATKKQAALAFSQELAKQGCPVAITVVNGIYTIWVSFQAFSGIARGDIAGQIDLLT